MLYTPSQVGLWNTWTAPLQRGKTYPMSIMLELRGMRSILLLPSVPGPLWPRVVVPDMVLSMVQIELNCVLMLNWIVWNRTVYMYKNEFGIKLAQKWLPKMDTFSWIYQFYLTSKNLHLSALCGHRMQYVFM